MRGARPWVGVHLAACLLVAVVAILCVVVYENYSRNLPPLTADETGHALPAARMACDLRRGDLRSFVADTQREMLWPFVHPWYLTIFFLLFGISTEVGRASSLVAYGASIVAAFLLARELSRPSSFDEPTTRDPVGTLAAVLMIVNADTWSVSSMIMIEPLGILTTLACLLSHARALRRRSQAACLATGVLAALTFLTKYNYGVPLIGALVLCLCARGRDAWPGRRSRLLLLLGMALPVLAWLAYPFPDKLQWLYRDAINRDEGLSTLQSVLFYPSAMAGIVSWPVAAWLLAAPLLVVWRRADLRPRLPAFLALLGLASLVAHPNKQTRYACTIVPVLYVLGELELARIARAWSLSAGVRRGVWVTLGLMFAVLSRPLSLLQDDLISQRPYRSAAAIFGFVANGVRSGDRTLVVGTTGFLPHQDIAWEMIVRHQGLEPVVETLPFPGEDLTHLPPRRGYPTGMTPEYERHLDSALATGGYDQIVALAVADDSPLMPTWLRRWDAWSQNYVRLMEGQTVYPLTATRAFPLAHVEVRVYSKPAGSVASR